MAPLSSTYIGLLTVELGEGWVPNEMEFLCEVAGCEYAAFAPLSNQLQCDLDLTTCPLDKTATLTFYLVAKDRRLSVAHRTLTVIIPPVFKGLKT